MSWLEHLQGLAYLTLHRDFTARWRIDSVVVLADDLDNPPPPKQPTPARRSAVSSAPRVPFPTERPADSARATASPVSAPAPAAAAETAESLAPARLAPLRGTAEPRLRCRRCELPLDPILAERGLHVLC